jgi:hypothetical protein
MPTPDASDSATEAAAASSSIAIPKVEKEEYLWEMTSEDIRNWLQGAQPLFPKPNIGKFDWNWQRWAAIEFNCIGWNVCQFVVWDRIRIVVNGEMTNGGTLDQ